MKKLTTILTSFIFTFLLIGCEDSNNVTIEQPIQQVQQDQRVELVEQELIEVDKYSLLDVERYYQTCLIVEGFDQDDYCEDICGYEFDVQSCDFIEDKYETLYGIGADSPKKDLYMADYRNDSSSYKNDTYNYNKEKAEKSKIKARTTSEKSSTTAVSSTKKTSAQSNLVKKPTVSKKSGPVIVNTNEVKKSTTQSNLVKKPTPTVNTKSTSSVKKSTAQSNLVKKPKKVAVTIKSKSGFKKTGSPYSCGSYSPSTSSKKKGTSFTQKAKCKQKESQTIYYSDGTSKKETRIVSTTKSKSAKGTRK